MKNKTKCLLIIAIFALLLISLTTFSYAKTNLQVSDINVTVTKAKAEITWSKATNADGYDVYVDFPEVGYQFVGTVKNNNVQIIGFDESKTYAVKVKAYKYESGKTTYSDFSPEVKFGFETSSQITTKVGNITRIQATVASNGTYGTVEWNEASNATGYEIYASVGNGSFSYIGEVNSNRITVIGIKENIVYKVQVKPYTTVNGQRIYGSVSDTVVLKYEKEENPELVIKPEKVTGLNVTMDGKNAKLNWNKVSDADGYEVVINIPGIGECKYTETDTSRYMTGFTNTTDRYYIKVRAYKYVDGKKIYGDYSSRKYFYGEQEEVDKVTGVVVKRSGSAAKFSWNRVAGADGYEIVIDIPGIGECTYNETATSRYMTGFTETKYK